MTETIGQQLKKRREAQQLSLEQAAQATRIKLHYLQALEADHFEALPSKVQLRGFLRTYASLLNLSPESLLAQLDGAPPAQLSQQTGSQPPEPENDFSPHISPSQPSAAGEYQPSASAPLIQLGNLLRQQRQALGLSLEDVERNTFLRLRYLQALENGRLEDLPSPVQGRGMLNNYATFLGLDPEPALLLYAEGLQADLRARQALQSQALARESPPPSRAPHPLTRLLKWAFPKDLWIGGIIITFLIGFVVWAALRIAQMQSLQEPTATAISIAEVLAQDTPTLTITPTLLATPATPTSPESEIIETIAPSPIAAEIDTTATLSAPLDLSAIDGRIQLYLVARQRAWTRVIVDGKVELEGRLTPGSAYLFTANERIELTTGNGAALQAFLNRQDLGPLGIYGEVVERIFTAQGMQTPTPAVPPTPTSTSTSEITPTPTGSITPATATPTPTSVIP